MALQDTQAKASSSIITREQVSSIITSRAQELILLPTEKCNFRCAYCYEDFAIGKMSEATQRGVERLIERRMPSLDRLNLTWFGGEPLLAKEIVLRIARSAHALSEQHEARFNGGLTTNGYLLDFTLFEELVSYRQNFFQITLDGWGEVHDEVRKLANGRGTFDVIWGNLLAMKASKQRFEVLLRIHVRRENIEPLSMLMQQIALAFDDDPRFRFGFEHVRNLGGEGGRTINRPVEFRELVGIEADLRRLYNVAAGRAEETTFHEVIAGQLSTALSAESAGSQRLEDLVKGGSYICYASRPNSLLVRADGRVGKCTVALYDDRNTIGRLDEDGTVAIDQDKLRPWIRGIADFDEATLACPLKGLPHSKSPGGQAQAVQATQ